MLTFPYFARTRRDEDWVDWQTANYIRTLWRAASAKQRTDPEFLLVLARWAGLPETASDGDLSARLAQILRLTAARAKWLVRTDSGITRY